MEFTRLYDQGLAQASYAVACDDTQQVLFVDPRADIDTYIEWALARGYTVSGVAETHIHADFFCGARALARSTGAKLYLSGETGEAWQYRGLEGLEAEALHDGATFSIGRVRVQALHTPGHTPEHLSFLITAPDEDEPQMALTGDFMFVGELGRPDLLEAVGGQQSSAEGSAEEGARAMFRSLRRFCERVPDYVQVWPGHGAGSSCGAHLSSIPSSTVGYERRHAWWSSYLVEDREDQFVDDFLASQPEVPRYYKTMKIRNRDGFSVPERIVGPPKLTPHAFQAALSNNALVLDLRSIEEFAKEHLAGSLSLCDLSGLSSYLGWIAPYETKLVIIVEDARAQNALRALYRIGLFDVQGYVPKLDGYTSAQRQRLDLIAMDEAQVKFESGQATPLDVRSKEEFERGHIPGALHIHYGMIEEQLDQIPRDSQIVTYCGSGIRANLAASLLQRHGYEQVANAGGFPEWKEAGKPVHSP